MNCQLCKNLFIKIGNHIKSFVLFSTKLRFVLLKNVAHLVSMLTFFLFGEKRVTFEYYTA